jgi:signal transduction histidine kinase/CheY-like chemotaxis protein
MSDKQATPPLVLVADDEIPTTVMLQRIFEREGYHVECVNDGISALEAAQRLLPDLILLDIQMPRMNGFDVLRTLRENASTAAIPTILITAKARQPSDVAKGLNLGADDYMNKPFDPRELLARAESKIKARQLEETLHRRSQELAALLRAGEELNQHLEVSELLDLVLYLALDLLPGDAAVAYQVDEQRQIITARMKGKNDSRPPSQLDHKLLVRSFFERNPAVLWPEDEPLVEGFAQGMAVPLEHGANVLGILVLLGNSVEYDENHLRLFRGIGRQAALAMRNAQLYEIQANYALHLEDMVAARTAELQSAQQMLIRSEKLASIGHLAASIAHEINNPLQPIRNILDDMSEDLQRARPVDPRDIAILQESVERIRRIVSQLLEFTGKRTTGDSTVQLLDISSVVEGIITLNRKFLEKERVTVTANLPLLPRVYGSKDQLEQVFMNLTLNAQAAMAGGGNLEISVSLDGEEIVVEFADTGCGIPPEQIDRIFDPFYSTKPNGTGLGLFVSYGIIQSHHGTIEVESKVNVGTTFTLRFPAHAET